MGNDDLFGVTNDELLREIVRRLRELSRRLNTAAGQGKRGAARPMALPPAANAARQQIAQSLRAGRRPPRAVEVVGLLAASERALKMSDIDPHMRRHGFKRPFYDLCNALADVEFAERCYVGTKKGWKITPAGVAWVTRSAMPSTRTPRWPRSG